jgi:hypothetical protein
MRLASGRGVVRWVPTDPGRTRVRVTVVGLDGTRIADATSFQVLSRPPVIRIVDMPKRAVVGRLVRISFTVAHGRHASVRVATRSGIEFTRRYLLRDHVGVLKWIPENPGRAVLLLRARGRQGQIATARLRLHVRPHASTAPPSIELLRVPGGLVPGTPATFVLRADDCRVAVARIRGPEDDVQVWRFPCPVQNGSFDWTPASAGRYELTLVARAGHGLTASQQSVLRVREDTTTSSSVDPPSGSRRGPSRVAVRYRTSDVGPP